MAEKFTCFLIDDDEDDREIFALSLKDAGERHLCITASSATKALEMLNTGEFIPDYIFLDLNMPLVSGKQFLMEIKQSQRLKNITVIIFTTSAHSRDMEDTKQLGATHYLIKPPSTITLTKILVMLFERPNLPFCLNDLVTAL